jgi:hypothetical protein
MSITSRARRIALIGVSAALFSASGSAQDATTAGASKYGDPLLSLSFLNDPALVRSAQWTSWGTVATLQGGWGIDRMLVFHAAPMINSDPPCQILTNGYIVNETHTGHTLFNTMLMTALLNKREVAFVISGCYEQRPQIVSVAIR